MTEYICGYCREPIEKLEDGVIDLIRGDYFHNAQGCPVKKLSENQACYDLYAITNFETPSFRVIPLTELDELK